MADHAIRFSVITEPELPEMIKSGDRITVIDRNGEITELLVKDVLPAEGGGRRVTFDDRPNA